MRPLKVGSIEPPQVIGRIMGHARGAETPGRPVSGAGVNSLMASSFSGPLEAKEPRRNKVPEPQDR
jgi:hypothetical protein